MCDFPEPNIRWPNTCICDMESSTLPTPTHGKDYGYWHSVI